MGRERGQPVYREIVDPNDEDRQVDRQDPEHEHQDRMGIVVEARVDARALCVC